MAKSKAAKKRAKPGKENAVTRYLRETRAELRRVHWPSRREAWSLTKIVLGATISMAILLGLLDYLFSVELKGIIAGSHLFMVACKGDEIVGMGRALSDRSSDAYIQDVTVKSEYRSQGIGTTIIRELVRRLRSDGIEWIGLIAERGSHGFYARLGFKEMPNALPMLKLDS